MPILYNVHRAKGKTRIFVGQVHAKNEAAARKAAKDACLVNATEIFTVTVARG